MDLRRLGVSLRGALALALVLWGCGGGTGGGSSNRTPQFVLKPVGSSSAAGVMIVGLDKRSIDANQADRVRVTAQVLDPSGRALGGIGVTFHASMEDVTFVDGVPADVNDGLPAATAVTDGAGIAVVTVQAGATAGRLAIQAFTTNLNLDLGGVVFLELTNVGFVSGNLQVLPSEIELEDPKPGTVLEFLVTGGTPFTPPAAPYRLQDGTSAVGTAVLVDQGVFPVTIRYTVTGRVAGTHVFNVVDAAGKLASGTVVVSVSNLVIQPNSANVVAGGRQVFAVAGGVAPYQCRSSAGSLYPATVERGGSLTFDSTGIATSTAVTVVCTDVTGQSVTAQVSVSVPEIFLQPPSASLSGGQSQTFVIGGGAPPYRCEATGGTISPGEVPVAGGSVVFTATPAATQVSGSLSCVDSGGAAVTAAISINSLTPEIQPRQATIAPGASQTFAITSGTAPYQCSATGGAVSPTTVSASGGTFTFTSNPSSTDYAATILCRDATGQVATADVDVRAESPILQPASATVPSGGNQVFAITGGTAPYSCVATGGTVAPSSIPIAGGSFTFKAVQTAVQVQGSVVCTDANGKVVSAGVTVTTDAPRIDPGRAIVAPGARQIFAVSGGSAPYVCEATGGRIDPATVDRAGGTFVFTADRNSTITEGTILCRDASGQVATAVVAIGASDLVVAPSQATVPGGGSQVFAVSGGLPPYRCQTSLGSLSPSTIEVSGGTTQFTAELVAAPVSGTLVCNDSGGQVATATISVTTTAPKILPPTVAMFGGQSQVFAISEGQPPYECTTSGGVLNPRVVAERGGTTIFTAAPVSSQVVATILCTDAAGQVASAAATINPAPTPTPNPSTTPVPTTSPAVIKTIIVRSNPTSVDGVLGGTTTIVATVFDEFNQTIPGVTVLFTLPESTGDPTGPLPFVDPLTATTNDAGIAVTILNVPPGTPPQFIVVTATARNVTGKGQVAVTSRNVDPPGPPANLTSALFYPASGDDGDGTYVTVLSALVTDSNGNPAVDGLPVTWSILDPLSANVVSPTKTNELPGCNLQPFETAAGVTVTAQPGTALSCLIFPSSLVGTSVTVRVSVPGTTLVRTTTFTIPDLP